MAFIDSILFLLGFGILAYILVWLFFKFPDKSSGNTGELSTIDKDLVKIKEEANIHRLKPFILALSLFVVSIYIFKLITYQEKREFVVIEKAKRTYHTDGTELEVPDVDIPDPEPPKPEVVFTPKVVANNVEIKAPDNKPLLEDELFPDDDNDLKDKPKEKDETPKGPIFVANPQVIASFNKGGDAGLDDAMILSLEAEMSKLEPGMYVIPLVFNVEVDGSISKVVLAPDAEVENMQVAKLVMGALKKLGRVGAFTPGSNDGQPVSSPIEKPFIIQIE